MLKPVLMEMLLSTLHLTQVISDAEWGVVREDIHNWRSMEYAGKAIWETQLLTGASLPSEGKGLLRCGSLCIISLMLHPKRAQVSGNLFFELKEP